MCDAFQSFSQLEVANIVSENCSDFISIDVESPRRKISSLPKKLLVPEHVWPIFKNVEKLLMPDKRKKPRFQELQSVSVEDIVGKNFAYLEVDSDRFDSISLCTNKFIVLRKLCKLEFWLSEQFSAKGFESLGYGDIWSFMEKHMHLFVHALLKILLRIFL